MTISPELETFFLALTLEHGFTPVPVGVEVLMSTHLVSEAIKHHPAAPELLKKVRRNYAELGGRLVASDDDWFYSRIAMAYLQWLAEQETGDAPRLG